MRGDEELHRRWKWGVVVGAYLLSACGSLATVMLMEQYRSATLPIERWRLLIISGATLGGTAFWGMHQVGMCAQEVICPDGEPCESSYNSGLVAVSFIVVVICSIIGLRIASSDRYFDATDGQRVEKLIVTVRKKADLKNLVDGDGKSLVQRKALFGRTGRLIVGSVITGIGAVAMHFIGLIALRMRARQRYYLWQLVVSICVGIVCLLIAFWIFFRVLRWRPYKSLRYLATAVMGLALTAMHFSSMVATRYYALPTEHVDQGPLPGASPLQVVSVAIILGVPLCTLALSEVADSLRQENVRRAKDIDAILKQLVHLLESCHQAKDPAASTVLGPAAAEERTNQFLLAAYDTLDTYCSNDVQRLKDKEVIRKCLAPKPGSQSRRRSSTLSTYSPSGAGSTLSSADTTMHTVVSIGAVTRFDLALGATTDVLASVSAQHAPAASKPFTRELIVRYPLLDEPVLASGAQVADYKVPTNGGGTAAQASGGPMVSATDIQQHTSLSEVGQEPVAPALAGDDSRGAPGNKSSYSSPKPLKDKASKIVPC